MNQDTRTESPDSPAVGRYMEFPARSDAERPQTPETASPEANGPQSLVVPRSRRNDKYDPTPAELWLIRAGHHTWQAWKAALKADALADVKALDAALDTIWSAKRAVRAELREKRAREAQRMRDYFASRSKAA